MPQYCSITVFYMNGKTEEYYGGIHRADNVLHIYPQHGAAVHIPLSSIQKYTTN